MQPPENSQRQEPEELVKFREAWKAELRNKRANPASPNPPPGPSTSPQDLPESAVPLAKNPYHPVLTTPVTSRSNGTAVDIYRKAVQHEHVGELDDALRLYRQAFRLEPSIDVIYRREEILTSFLSQVQGPTLDDKSPGSTAHLDRDADNLTKNLQNIAIGTNPLGIIVTGTLAAILANFPTHLMFESEDEKEGTPVKSLPDELLVLILRKLDASAIERFAAVSRKARVISLDPQIWRELVLATYRPPQVPDAAAVADAVGQFMGDYRRLYVERPRVRMDGVYIAVCHYVRAGLSDNSWVNISHLITYHRYLRFFPNGQVLSLLANEEYGPQHVIPILKPTLRMKGLSVGRWKLINDTVHITNLLDASGRYAIHPSLQSHIPPSDFLLSSSASSPDTDLRHFFQMTLHLRSRPLGRWNRLDMSVYESVNIESGEAMGLPLRNEKPFWFSKVKSYSG